MTLATLFLAQATNTPLTLSQELGILLIAMLTSKGASGVTGAGFVTLAATLAIVPNIPTQSLAILVGIDKFMSECRALTNLVGNGVATIVMSRLEGELDRDKLCAAMAHPVEIGAGASGGSVTATSRWPAAQNPRVLRRARVWGWWKRGASARCMG
jgi:aerobic C4-dicarboxylate transport protein